MYAVIFKAKLKNLENDYFKTAVRMRELAIQQYGCLEFISSCENGFEISISYWSSLQQIQDWKQAKEHQIAQEKGRSSWYESYSVQVTEVLREYDSKT